MSAIPLRPSSISQELLDKYLRVRNERLDRYQEELAIANQVLEILIYGGAVEPGTHHAEIRTVSCGPERRQMLYVDGKSSLDE